jgi:Family of unknown function (DUF5372)
VPWKSCVQCGLWRESSTTVDANGLSASFKITHPFHPWSGQTFELITYLHTWGENRVYFQRQESEHLISVPAIWTDVIPEDPFVRMASGRSLFRVSDLLELVQMVVELPEKHVKEITP